MKQSKEAMPIIGITYEYNDFALRMDGDGKVKYIDIIENKTKIVDNEEVVTTKVLKRLTESEWNKINGIFKSFKNLQRQH